MYPGSFSASGAYPGWLYVYQGCRIRISLRGGLQWSRCRPLLFSDRRPYRTPYTRTLLSMAVFSTGVWVMGIFFFRQTLKLLLSYHGWMFEMHGQTSHLTRVWAVSGSQWRGPGIWFETAGPHFGF